MFLCTSVLVSTMVVFSHSQLTYEAEFLNAALQKRYQFSERPHLTPTEEPEMDSPTNSCPEKLSASWLLTPPFVTNTNISGSNRSVEAGGIFHEVLALVLNRCCSVLNGGNQTVISYNGEAAVTKSLLHKAILENEADIILPVQSDQNEYKGYLPYLKILESPGIVLIRRTDPQRGNIALLWTAIGGCWPIVMLTLMLSFVAGMCVWAMETTNNNKEFGSPFYRGVFDGFWWAFVTMSTVGYGDKIPKSITARLFSVLWIMIGITVSSILTATLSSALTKVTVVERYDVLTGMKIGAVRDSIALQKAVNLGVNATVFQNLDEVYDALVDKQSLDGMLEEMFTATEYLKWKENSQLSIVHLFEEKHGYGVAFKDNVKTELGEIWGCMSTVISFVTEDLYDVTHEHLVKGSASQQTPADAKSRGDQRIIDQKSPAFIATVVGLSGVTLAFLTINMMLKFCRVRRVSIPRHDAETGQEKAVFSYGDTICPQQDVKRLEFMVSELAIGPFTLRTTERNDKDGDQHYRF